MHGGAALKLSKVLHAFSVILGSLGLAMAGWAVLLWPAGGWFGLDRPTMLLCAIALLLAAIWIQLATMHHMMLEKNGENF